MAEVEDPYDDHPVRSKRNRKFPKVDRDKPVSKGIADPGPGPHKITVLANDANGVAVESSAVVLNEGPEPVVPEGDLISEVVVLDPQPEVEVEAAITTDLSEMTMPEVVLWAGDDPARRAYALASERERPKPRKGVLTALGG